VLAWAVFVFLDFVVFDFVSSLLATRLSVKIVSRMLSGTYDPNSNTELTSKLTHYFGLLWGLGLLLGYLATSGVKSDVVFFLGNPDFL